MKIFGAYVHARPDGRIFYVGKGTETRARNFNRNPHHGNVVKKHGEKNILVGFMPCSSEAIALELEIGLIKCLRRSGVALTNKTDGGDGVSGLKHSDVSREKMSGAQQQLWSDPAHRQKMSDAHKGQVISADNVAKLIAANKGKHRAESTKAKISLAHKGRQFSDEHRANIGAAWKMRAPLSAESLANIRAAAQRREVKKRQSKESK